MPHIVVCRKGTKVTAENAKHRITRNVSHFKRVNRQHHYSESDSEQDSNSGDSQERDAQHEDVNNHGNINAPYERPTRTRQAPVRYGDPIPSDLL